MNLCEFQKNRGDTYYEFPGGCGVSLLKSFGLFGMNRLKLKVFNHSGNVLGRMGLLDPAQKALLQIEFCGEILHQLVRSKSPLFTGFDTCQVVQDFFHQP